MAGTGNRGMATLGANDPSPGWKPGSCGGGGSLFIPPDRYKMQKKYEHKIYAQKNSSK